MKLLPGSPRPLGATWDLDGTNFALFSANATAVELCLFDEAGNETRLPLQQKTAHVWHAYVPGIPLGQRYGYRVNGPYEPRQGHRFNPNVVLLDPYARAVDGVENWARGCFAYELDHPERDLSPSAEQALGAPRGIVIDDDFDWEGDEPPRTPLRRSVIYEAHVRGLTKLHPDVPEELRGTYLGVAHPAVIAHLRELGITAIELMPVHAFVDDKHLLDRGLRNYWGYNTIGFFAPDVRYRAGNVLASEVRQFKQMVKALHQAGIEVLLDVVYNHTAEGNHLGPTFSLKGIDNATYYKVSAEDPRYYYDTTGTGNTLNVRSPQVLALIMDSLRYWASEMHVDGFRFDLAAALARQLYDVDQLSSFFTLIHQSPTLSQRKLIAEPWDVGSGGYQVGNFPVLWAEWNGRYRDSIRSLWRGDRGVLGEVGYRLTGSADLYEATGRQPSASVNLVTAHDGFTLRDLVSYEHKHNEANGEENRDGNDDERSRNFGVEGPTERPEVNALRARQQRSLLMTLLLSQGTPMLVAGDEFGRTQRGNNNAYCQDNETSWLDWRWSPENRALFDFTKRLIRLRNEHPALRRSKFFSGRDVRGTDLQDLSWWRADGQPMALDDWNDPEGQTLAMFLAGRGIDDTDEAGRPLVDDNFLLVLNASESDVTFRLPELASVREAWRLVADSALTAEEVCRGGETSVVAAHSIKLFRSHSRVVRAGGALHRLSATYRLQLHPGFGFRDAGEVAEYLNELGITDVYTLAASRCRTGQYARLRCRRPFAAQRRARRRKRVRRFQRRSPATRPRTACSISSRTTWGSRRVRIAFGTTFSRTARARHSRHSSTWIFVLPSPISAIACSCPSSMVSTATSSSAAISRSFGKTPHFALPTTSGGCRLRPTRSSRFSSSASRNPASMKRSPRGRSSRVSCRRCAICRSVTNETPSGNAAAHGKKPWSSDVSVSSCEPSRECEPESKRRSASSTAFPACRRASTSSIA